MSGARLGAANAFVIAEYPLYCWPKQYGPMHITSFMLIARPFYLPLNAFEFDDQTPSMPRPTDANIFDLLRRSVEAETKAKKTKAPPLQPTIGRKKAKTASQGVGWEPVGLGRVP